MYNNPYSYTDSHILNNKSNLHKNTFLTNSPKKYIYIYIIQTQTIPPTHPQQFPHPTHHKTQKKILTKFTTRINFNIWAWIFNERIVPKTCGKLTPLRRCVRTNKVTNICPRVTDTSRSLPHILVNVSRSN